MGPSLRTQCERCQGHLNFEAGACDAFQTLISFPKHEVLFALLFGRSED